jgi:preprotein translocase subunit YajC
MSNAAIQNLVMFGSMFAIIYLMILRPQQREKKKHEEAVLGIKKGDEIVTAGGLVGEVVHVKTTGTDGAATLSDRVTIRSGESRVVIERARIARVNAAGAAAASTSKTAGSGAAG